MCARFVHTFVVEFAWDEGKRQANLVKHGIDFRRAQSAFDGRANFTFQTPFADEERWITVAVVDGRAIAVVWTLRGEATIRIISARRARRGERQRLLGPDA
jgi:hypothetical protein